MKDRSLDEFCDGEGNGESDGESDAERSGDASGDRETEDAAPTAAGDISAPAENDRGQGAADARDPPSGPAATSRWEPDGGTCPDCGETVRRRWRADEEDPTTEFVCTDCKEW